VERNFGQIIKCKGKNCGQDIIFVEYYSKKKMKMSRTPVNAKPILVMVPFFDKNNDPRMSAQLGPEKWSMRQAFVLHHSTCPDVEDFKKR
jgi:hypothetical protein